MNVKSGGIPKSRLARWSLAILMLGTVMLAMSPIFVRWSEVGPVATGVNRLMLPLPVFFAWLFFHPEQQIKRDAAGRGLLLLVMLAGVFFAGDLMFWHTAIHMTSVANATVLGNLSPVFVVLGAWLLFKEQFNRIFLMGLAVALAGMAVLMGESFRVSMETFLGDGLACVAALFYAGYLLVISRVRPNVSTAATMAWSCLAGSIILYVVALIREGNIWPDTANGWWVAIGLAGITQIVGQGLVAMSFAYVAAGFGSMVLLLQPVLSSILAWVWFNEPLSVSQAVGGIAVLAGLYVARRGTAH